MPATQFIQRVTHHPQKVVVRTAERAVEIEVDDGLCLTDRRELALTLGQPQHAIGDVDGVLDDLERFAEAIEDDEVGRLYPDRLAVPADSLVLSGLSLAAAQAVPKCVIRRSIAVGLVHEHPVVLAAEVVAGIAGCL